VGRVQQALDRLENPRIIVDHGYDRGARMVGHGPEGFWQIAARPSVTERCDSGRTTFARECVEVVRSCCTPHPSYSSLTTTSSGAPRLDFLLNPQGGRPEPP